MRAIPYRKVLAATALLCALACASTTVAARELLAAPPGFEQDDEDGDEHVLTIPGLGRFPLPPGARVMRPGAAPKAAPARPPQETVRKPDPPPLTPAQRISELLGSLAQTKDEEEARRIAGLLQRFWAVSGSDTIDLLSARAAQAESIGAASVARGLLDSVVLLRPAFAEGFVRRARVRHALDDLAGATQDLEMALKLEPRRFDVMAMLGASAEEAGDKKRALALYRQSLAINPQQAPLKEREERLRFDVEGRDL
jgi:tetratricopeptide (TPR) repeat protein